MRHDLVHQHSESRGFDDMQSEALAAIFQETATTSDIELLRSELSGDMKALRSELHGDMKTLRSDMTALRNETTAGLNALRTEMATLKGNLTWRFVALTSLFRDRDRARRLLGLTLPTEDGAGGRERYREKHHSAFAFGGPMWPKGLVGKIPGSPSFPRR